MRWITLVVWREWLGRSSPISRLAIARRGGSGTHVARKRLAFISPFMRRRCRFINFVTGALPGKTPWRERGTEPDDMHA